MVIELNNIGKRFAYRWLYRNINLSFSSGKRYAIKGPNGSGKSTLLQLIATYLMPSEGKVHYYSNDQSISTENIFSKISFTAPYVELINEFNLGELYDFHQAFRALKVSKSAWIDLLDFGKEIHKPIQYFSSGMKQRVNLSLALCSEADVYLIDEPTTNLDAQGKIWYRQIVEDYCQNKILIIASNESSDHDFCEENISIDENGVKGEG